MHRCRVASRGGLSNAVDNSLIVDSEMDADLSPRASKSAHLSPAAAVAVMLLGGRAAARACCHLPLLMLMMCLHYNAIYLPCCLRIVVFVIILSSLLMRCSSRPVCLTWTSIAGTDTTALFSDSVRCSTSLTRSSLSLSLCVCPLSLPGYWV